MNEPGSVCAVVPAAGIGRRVGGDVPKQYLVLNGRPVLAHTVARLTEHRAVKRVCVAIAADDDYFSRISQGFSDKCVAVTGGAERCHSVLAALTALAVSESDDCWVLVHDAARPCLRAADVSAMLGRLERHAVGGILAAPVRDTLKRCDGDGSIVETVDRNAMWQAMTPQMFRLGMLRRAIERALADGIVVTDEAQAIEYCGLVPCVVPGHADNIKITHPEDLALAAAILNAQADET